MDPQTSVEEEASKWRDLWMTTARTTWKIGDVLECLTRELVVHSREAMSNGRLQVEPKGEWLQRRCRLWC